jgi:8-oxo-dGTP pyrophosphatase MutT (NUDIX family)
MTFPNAFKTYIPRTHCISSHVYGAILMNSMKEVILIKGRQSGKWSFPKGHGRSRETPLDACIRELKEETGIDMFGVIPDDEIRFNTGTYFVFFVKDRLEINTEDINEVEEAAWISLYRISQLRTNKDLNSFCRFTNINNILDKMPNSFYT